MFYLIESRQVGAMLCAFNHPHQQRVLEHLEFHEQFAASQGQIGNSDWAWIARLCIGRIGRSQFVFQRSLLLGLSFEFLLYLLRRPCSTA